jgi:hypothetical protein
MAQEIWCAFIKMLVTNGPLAYPILLLGNFVYANLMGTPFFVIGDREIAEELLNVRGRITASRPLNILTLDLCVPFSTLELVIDKL